MKYDGWENTVNGVSLVFIQDGERSPFKVHVNTADLIEVRDDLNEAILDPHGYRAVDILVRDMWPRDVVYILGNHYRVTNLMTANRGHEDEGWVIQFSDGSFGEVTTEAVLPGDQQVTVYRRPEDAAAAAAM